jgi:ankyrin repeat protein
VTALERENAVLAAQGGARGASADSFVSRLLDTVASLHNQPLYSDLTIITPSSNLHSHKFVLSCRSDTWGVPSLAEVESLDWTGLEEAVSTALLSWVYTDRLELGGGEEGDRFTLALMAAASSFALGPLVDRCEQHLMSSVSVSNCISFYATAHEIKAEKLASHCSQLISANWSQFSHTDFTSLAAELVYSMLKERADFPLHAAIGLRREDVVFLYLIQFHSQLDQRLNEPNSEGRLPLDLAAQGCGGSALHLLATEPDLTEVAAAVIRRGADLNIQNQRGETALHIAVIKSHLALLDLLLEAGADLELATGEGRSALWHALHLPQAAGDRHDSLGSIASRLVRAGADPSALCGLDGNSILHSFADMGNEEASLYLLSEGANVNLVNQRGESVLHLAAHRGLATLATALLVAGAPPNLQTGSEAGEVWRQSALHLALVAGQEAVVTCLLEFAQPNDGLTVTLLDINLRNSMDETPLALALARGFTLLAEQMIQSGADVNVTDASGLSLLLQAVLASNLAAASFLLQHGADISARSPQGETGLELAVRQGTESVAEALCRAGADTASSSTGEPPLWQALEAGAEDMASILVRHGADTDGWGAGPEGCQQTLLHRAVDENKEEAAIFLIRAGCDLDSARPGGEEDGQGPLHLATQWGQEGVVTALIEHGADLNKPDLLAKTALHHAIENGQQGIINLLLGCPGIDLTARDKSGLSPFSAAMTFKNNSAARVILELEPGAAEQPDARGKNYLHTAIIKSDLESLLFLISINVNVHSKTTDSNKLAPVLLAVQVGQEMMVRNLLLAGASTQERSLAGQTGLHLAAESDSNEIASVLLANGIDFNAVDELGNNALHVAVKEGHIKTARVLLTESQVSAELANSKGRSPLHELAKFADTNAVEMLDLFLECMTDYNIDRPDGEGNTPLLLAYTRGHGELCRALVRRGAILGTMNRNNVNIFNCAVATKQLLFRLLDLLSAEPRWGEGEVCEECQVGPQLPPRRPQAKFGITTRRHHCRHCGRLLCSKCRYSNGCSGDTTVPSPAPRRCLSSSITLASRWS